MKGAKKQMEKFTEDRMLDSGEPPKRKRGRPRKYPLPEDEEVQEKPRGVSCPSCGSPENYVHRSVPASGGRRVRQRICQACRARFETIEE